MPHIYSIFRADAISADNLKENLIACEDGVVQARGISVFDLNKNVDPLKRPRGLIVSPALEYEDAEEFPNAFFLNATKPPKVIEKRVHQAFYDPISGTLVALEGAESNRHVILLLKKVMSFQASNPPLIMKKWEHEKGRTDFLIMLATGNDLDITYPKSQTAGFSF
jgi:hypothetical protein